MVLYVKNKMVSLRDSSYVVDEQQNQVFEVRGKLVSPTNKKFVMALNGQLLYTVRNKYWHFFTKKAYIYDSEGAKIAKISERFFGRTMTITESVDDIEMQSQGFLKPINILKNGKCIGCWARSMEGGIGLFRDCYRLEVYDPAEAPFLVAMVVAVDNIRDNRNDD